MAFFGGLVLLASLHWAGNAQAQKNEQKDSWQSRLYEAGVNYENLSCNEMDAETVGAFFRERPLKKELPICHNDCPVIKCRPVVPFPAIAKGARVAGIVPVHVLVDEQGKVLYARVLSGHPLLWAAARKGACETQFTDYPHHKRQGVMHFTVDGYEYLGVPNTANQVR